MGPFHKQVDKQSLQLPKHHFEMSIYFILKTQVAYSRASQRCTQIQYYTAANLLQNRNQLFSLAL